MVVAPSPQQRCLHLDHQLGVFSTEDGGTTSGGALIISNAFLDFLGPRRRPRGELSPVSTIGSTLDHRQHDGERERAADLGDRLNWSGGPVDERRTDRRVGLQPTA